VCGVYFQDGCNEQKHHPFVVNVVDVLVISTLASVLEKGKEKVICGVAHQDARKDEKDVG
jgi:hypothetical protein